MALAVLAVVALVLLSDGDVPLVPGRPAASDPDPVGAPPGPMPGAGIQARFVVLDPAAVGVSARAGSDDVTSAADVRARIVASDVLERFGTENHGAAGSAGIDHDSGSPRATRGTDGVLIPVLVALIVLDAARNESRGRRRRTEAPAPAA